MSPTHTEAETEARAKRYALAAVQEAMDRRDNGGDVAGATDSPLSPSSQTVWTWRTAARRTAARPTPYELRAYVADGRIETVVLAMPDMQGRRKANAPPGTSSSTRCSTTPRRAAGICWPSR